MVLKALYLAVRAALVLACAFWALILMEILPAFLVTGISGVREKLLHIWSTGKVNLDLRWSCQDSLQLIHEGYTDLLVFVLLTWALLELKRFLALRLAAAAHPNFRPTPPAEPYSFDSINGGKP